MESIQHDRKEDERQALCSEIASAIAASLKELVHQPRAMRVGL